MDTNNKEKYNLYMREYHLKRYYSLRGAAIKYLGGKCVKEGCGSTENLELDHIDKNIKSMEVSRMLSVSLKTFWEEVKKCQLLCKQHHFEKTLLESGKKIAKGTHGTLSSYKYCKCELCKSAKREWTKKYLKTHKRVMVNGKRHVVLIT